MRLRSFFLIFQIAATSNTWAESSLPKAEVDAAINEAYKKNTRTSYARAAALIEGNVRQEPDLALRKSLGYIYLDKLQEPEKAYPVLKEVSASIPDDTDWLTLLARASTQTKRQREAIFLYYRIGHLSPQDPWSRLELAKLLIEMDRRHEAGLVLKEALAIDAKNIYAHLALARLDLGLGRKSSARTHVDLALSIDPKSAEAHTLKGDISRSEWSLSEAADAYDQALLTDSQFSAANQGKRELQKLLARRITLTYYTFQDSEDLSRTGIYTGFQQPFANRFALNLSTNYLQFERPGFTEADRWEWSGSVLAHLAGNVSLQVGVNGFQTSDLNVKAGVELGLYISPIHWLDLAASYKSAQPVNDGINAILLGYTQNVGSGSVTARLGRGISAFTRGSYARYSDENDRWNGVGGVQYYSPWPWLKRVALEYEILQFANRTGVYSSPEDDRFLRPVIDFAPALNDWASLDLHVEIPYVFNDEEWGHGIRAGVRFQWADCSLGVAYLNYQIPGGQTIWSGEGFNIDLQCKF